MKYSGASAVCDPSPAHSSGGAAAGSSRERASGSLAASTWRAWSTAKSLWWSAAVSALGTFRTEAATNFVKQGLEHRQPQVQLRGEVERGGQLQAGAAAGRAELAATEEAHARALRRADALQQVARDDGAAVLRVQAHDVRPATRVPVGAIRGGKSA